jgi:hypothetical protein
MSIKEAEMDEMKLAAKNFVRRVRRDFEIYKKGDRLDAAKQPTGTYAPPATTGQTGTPESGTIPTIPGLEEPTG